MGRRVIQHIFECNYCGKTPEHGESLWDMSREGYICEDCIDLDRDDQENPELLESV